jgi:hypothetical protein
VALNHTLLLLENGTVGSSLFYNNIFCTDLSNYP